MCFYNNVLITYKTNKTIQVSNQKSKTLKKVKVHHMPLDLLKQVHTVMYVVIGFMYVVIGFYGIKSGMTRSIKCIMNFYSGAAINLKFTDSKEQIQPELTPIASNQDKSEDRILHDSRKEDQGQTGTRTWWL